MSVGRSSLRFDSAGRALAGAFRLFILPLVDLNFGLAWNFRVVAYIWRHENPWNTRKPGMKLTAVLFDLDGTLVDSSQDIINNLNRSLNDLGFSALSKETVLLHVGYGAPYLIEKCLSEFLPPAEISKEMIETGLTGFRRHYLEHLIDDSKPYPDVFDFLNHLETIPLGVISNKPEVVVQGVLKALKMDHYFQFMYGRDSTDWKKPDPRIIHQGLARVGVPASKSVWFVGDSFVDVQTAKAAGVTAVALEQGYTPRERLMAEKPDLLVKDFPKLLVYLLPNLD